MSRALLIDIGSTYTKASLLNLNKLEIEGRSQAFTTAENNINTGLNRALAGIKDWRKATYKLACSSAAGGLKLIAVGLVPSLTVEAANRAALGAGSRVINTYSYYLNQQKIAEIIKSDPDLILLAGGTDGGNKEVILHNARILAHSNLNRPILVAGNAEVSKEVIEILGTGDKEIYLTENVMPGLEELNIEPARQMIRRIFLERIIKARGLDRVQELVDKVVMPTPAAVLQATELLADGVNEEEGWGELLVIDVGGATTDVHSAASGNPVESNVRFRGLEEPYLKRTVEGDLGIRYNAPLILDMVGSDVLQQELYNHFREDFGTGEITDYIDKIRNNPAYLGSEREKKLDSMLGRKAVSLAIVRHAGTRQKIRTPGGSIYLQTGKDLSRIKKVIGTGGVIVHNNYHKLVLTGILQERQSEPEVLTPVRPEFYIDRKYLLAQLGLLVDIDAEIAIIFMKKYLQEVGDCGGDIGKMLD